MAARPPNVIVVAEVLKLDHVEDEFCLYCKLYDKAPLTAVHRAIAEELVIFETVNPVGVLQDDPPVVVKTVVVLHDEFPDEQTD